MTDYYTTVGHLIANELYINQGWGRKGLGIERLCNKLGELQDRIEALETRLAKENVND